MNRRQYLAGTGVALASTLAGCGETDDERPSAEDDPDAAPDEEASTSDADGTNGEGDGDTTEDSDENGETNGDDDAEGTDEEEDVEAGDSDDDSGDDEQNGEGGDGDDEQNGEDGDSDDEQNDDGGDGDGDEENGEDGDDDTPVEFSFSDTNGSVGDELTITGSIHTATGGSHTIGGYEAVITYDPDIVTVTSVESTPFQLAVNDQNGTINTVGTTPEGSETPVSDAIEIQFTAETAGEMTVAFEEAASSVIDVDGTDIEVRYHSGTVSIAE